MTGPLTRTAVLDRVLALANRAGPSAMPPAASKRARMTIDMARLAARWTGERFRRAPQRIPVCRAFSPGKPQSGC